MYSYSGVIMWRFVSAATAFYLLAAGESLTKHEIYHRYYPARYVIWPRADGWELREMGPHGWQKISDSLFETENAAFNFEYDRFCYEQDKKKRAWRS